MTTVYTDYYKAYDTKKFDIRNVDFRAYIVSEDYKPDKIHKPKDITPFIVFDAGYLRGDIIAKKGMGEIVEYLEQSAEREMGIVEDIEVKAVEEKETIKVESLSITDVQAKREAVKLKIDSVIKDEKKREVLKEKIDRVDEREKITLWQDLHDNGIKYLVVMSEKLGILCFCEEI